VRLIDRGSIGAWRWQILRRDFSRYARRIACPIAHYSFAREYRAFFSGFCDYEADYQNSRQKRLRRTLHRSIGALSSQWNRSAPNPARI
jgi:hypothetical protein